MGDAALKINGSPATLVGVAEGLRTMDAERGDMTPLYPGARLPTFRLATIAAYAVAMAFDVARISVKAKPRGARKVAAARQYAMALVHLVTGRSQDDVAKHFKRNRTTASNHMEMVEWLNDVPEHNAFWEELERRYLLLVELAELGDGRAAWLLALRGIDRALDDGDIEQEACDQAKYIAATFRDADNG